MKFAFLIDTSPLMLLKSPVVGSYDKAKSCTTGMNFFE
jgi:hypothetical protein